MGRYVTNAAINSSNYVDPRIEPPVGNPVKIPWNGFPRLLSRWYDDEQSVERKEEAEKTAEIGTPIVSWVMPDQNGLRVFDAEQHRLPFFADRLGDIVLQLARPLRQILPNGTIGDEVVRMRRQQDEYGFTRNRAVGWKET